MKTQMQKPSSGKSHYTVEFKEEALDGSEGVMSRIANMSVRKSGF